jgi:prefoldin subunit 5
LNININIDDDEEMYTNYSLCDTIYAKAKIDINADKVALYVGAKSFIEYNIDEALNLIKTQIQQSFEKLNELNEDLVFLRTSSITVEVNMARLFNYSVKEKKKAEGN